MDRAYTQFFPEDDLPKKKKRSGRRIAVTVAVILTVALLIGIGIGAYAILKPPALGRAAMRTANDLAGTDSLLVMWDTLVQSSKESGAIVTAEGRLPEELTGAGALEVSLRAQTASGEDPVARYDVTLSTSGADPVALSLYRAPDRWVATGLYPDESDRAVYVPKVGIVDALERSAWNPAVGGEDGLSEEEYQMIREIARAVERAGEEDTDGSGYSEEEQKELREAARALSREWREIIAPELERSLTSGLSKTVRLRYDYEKLLEMVAALRQVMEEYPVFAELLRSTVTVTEYGEEMFTEDAIVAASLPAADIPALIPLSAEAEGNEGETMEETEGLDALLDHLEEWLTEEKERFHFEAEVILTVSGGRLSGFTLTYLRGNRDGDRETYEIALFFFRPDARSEEEQLLATASLYRKLEWAATVDYEAGSYEHGKYLRYTRRENEREAEYVLTVASDPALADQEDPRVPEQLSAEETETADTTEASDDPQTSNDPEAWEPTARWTLRYDRDAEKYRFIMENRDTEADEWKPFIAVSGVWRMSDSGKRFEFGLTGLTVTAPAFDENGKETGETVENEWKPELTVVWEVGDGASVELPAEAENLLDYTVEDIRALREAGLDIRVSDVLASAFGGSEALYTVDGVRLRDTEYYQSVAQSYLNLYQGYVNRNGDQSLWHLCIYDEEIGMYVLLDYDVTNNFLAINFLAKMTERYEAAYHTGVMWHGRLEGHMFEETEGLAPTCESAGYYAYACAYCDDVQTKTREAKGHTIVERTELRTYDDGLQRREIYRWCEVCGIGATGKSMIWNVSRYDFYFLKDRFTGDVSLNGGYSAYTDRGTMLRIPDYAGSDGKYPVTKLSFDSFSDEGMYNLALIRFGENIRHVEKNAFAGASGLQVLVLNAALERIDANAFAGCTSLRKVYFCGTEAQWKQIQIAEGNEPLTDAEIIFNHDGSFVGGDVINTAAAASSLRTLIANSRDGKQGEILAAHPDAKRLTVLSTAAASAVAYDADSNTVIVCGGYDSAGGVTTVTFFHADTGAVTKTWSLPYLVAAMDAGDGYVVFGEANVPTVHLYRLSDGAEVATYDVKMYSSNDRIGYVFIDQGTVIACNAEQHCSIDFYKITAGTHVKSESMYEPALALDKESHTLAAISQNSSPKSIYFYDSQTGKQITWLWNVDTSSPIRWNGTAFETWKMNFSIAGEPIGQSSGMAPWAVKNSMVYETVMSAPDFVFWMVAVGDSDRGVVLARTMAATEQVSLSEPIAFYATQILRMGGEDRFLMWDEGYTQLLIVDLR